LVVKGMHLPWDMSDLPITVKSKEIGLFATLPRDAAVLKEKKHLQPWLTKNTPFINGTTFKVTWVDGHKTPSIDTRKPDIVHYPKDCSPSVYQLAYVGDLKSQTASDDGVPSDDAIACMIDFLCALAAVQVWRQQFIGYLLDGKHISFFVFVFDVSPRRGDKRALVRRKKAVHSCHVFLVTSHRPPPQNFCRYA
jgi:hypothetical protein